MLVKRKNEGIDMEQSRFVFTYSAKDRREVEDIRKKYLLKEESRINRLKLLDGKVQSAGTIESLIVGILGVLILGFGLCIGLGVLEGGTLLGAIFFFTGILVMIPAYPVYRLLRQRVRERYVPEILRLAGELCPENEQK